MKNEWKSTKGNESGKKNENPFSMPVIFFYAEFSTPSLKNIYHFSSKKFLTPENDVDFCLSASDSFMASNTHTHANIIIMLSLFHAFQLWLLTIRRSSFISSSGSIEKKIRIQKAILMHTQTYSKQQQEQQRWRLQYHFARWKKTKRKWDISGVSQHHRAI